MKYKLIRPGDIIRLTTTRFGTHLKGKKFVVTEARYMGAPRFGTPDFAWVEENECEYAGRAPDAQFLAAFLLSEYDED